MNFPRADVSERIASGELSSALFLGAASLAAGIINAASMTYCLSDADSAVSAFSRSSTLFGPLMWTNHVSC